MKIDIEDVIDQLVKDSIDKTLSCKDAEGKIHYSDVLKIIAHFAGNLDRALRNDRISIEIKDPEL